MEGKGDHPEDKGSGNGEMKSFSLLFSLLAKRSIEKGPSCVKGYRKLSDLKTILCRWVSDETLSPLGHLAGLGGVWALG